MSFEKALKIVQKFQRDWGHQTLEGALAQMKRSELLTGFQCMAYSVVSKQHG